MLELYRRAILSTDRPGHDGTIRGLIGSMDEAGIDMSVLLPVATKESQVNPINTGIEPYLDSKRILPFAAIHPDTPDLASATRRIARAGFKGVKLHPILQRFHPQEERMMPLYETAAEEGLVILFHAGATLDADDFYGSRGDFDAFFERFAYDRVVLAHLGGISRLDADPEVLEGRPGYMDLAYLVSMVSPAKILEAARTHGCDRILFGTDTPWSSQARDVARMSGIGFSDAELEAIMHGNAERLLGL